MHLPATALRWLAIEDAAEGRLALQLDPPYSLSCGIAATFSAFLLQATPTAFWASSNTAVRAAGNLHAARAISQ